MAPFQRYVPEGKKKMVNSSKMMSTIVWNPYEFHAIEVLPSGYKFNSEYYISHILDHMS
jgi:hypothetical protein